MNGLSDKALNLAKEIEEFPLGKCGPSDDPDMQYAYTAAFRDLAVRFVSYLRRIEDPELEQMLLLVPMFKKHKPKLLIL